MPTSSVIMMTEIAELFCRVNPATVLDIGVGFGRNGAIFREAADARWGRCRPDQWQCKIDGVEVFAQYNNPQWGVYDRVFIEDIRTFVKKPFDYEFIFLGDVLEHLPQKDAANLIFTLRYAAKKCLAICLPLGHSPQDAMFGNKAEQHVSVWQEEDFRGFKKILKGKKGLFYIMTDE